MLAQVRWNWWVSQWLSAIQAAAGVEVFAEMDDLLVHTSAEDDMRGDIYVYIREPMHALTIFPSQT